MTFAVDPSTGGVIVADFSDKPLLRRHLLAARMSAPLAEFPSLPVPSFTEAWRWVESISDEAIVECLRAGENEC
jgi:hypothetical protein